MSIQDECYVLELKVAARAKIDSENHMVHVYVRPKNLQYQCGASLEDTNLEESLRSYWAKPISLYKAEKFVGNVVFSSEQGDSLGFRLHETIQSMLDQGKINLKSAARAITLLNREVSDLKAVLLCCRSQIDEDRKIINSLKVRLMKSETLRGTQAKDLEALSLGFFFGLCIGLDKMCADIKQFFLRSNQ